MKSPIPYTAKGCDQAREYLNSQKIKFDSGLTGWEIIHLANRILQEQSDLAESAEGDPARVAGKTSPFEGGRGDDSLPSAVGGGVSSFSDIKSTAKKSTNHTLGKVLLNLATTGELDNYHTAHILEAGIRLVRSDHSPLEGSPASAGRGVHSTLNIHNSTLKTLQIPKEIYTALESIAAEISTQDNRATAKPYIFQVRHKVKQYVPAGTGDHVEYVDIESESEYEGTPAGVKEYCEYNDMEWPNGVGMWSPGRISTWFEENTDCREAHYIYRDEYSNAFLTEKACKNHIKQNHYHYGRPDDFLSHAFRNPELELIFKFLELLPTTRHPERSDLQEFAEGDPGRVTKSKDHSTLKTQNS